MEVVDRKVVTVRRVNSFWRTTPGGEIVPNSTLRTLRFVFDGVIEDGTEVRFATDERLAAQLIESLRLDVTPVVSVEYYQPLRSSIQLADLR
jgi:hypothetical protein